MKHVEQSIINKIAFKDIRANLSKNLILLFAVSISAFMISIIISLCLAQIETQRTYSLQNFGKADSSIEPIIYVLLVVIVLVMFAGFLLIYNVMSINISRNIRFYGMMKLVGMTSQQVKRIFLKQVFIICAAGILLGIALSVFATQKIIPYFLEMYVAGITQDKALFFYPGSYISTVLLIFFISFCGTYIPIKNVTNLSSIDAFKFREYNTAFKRVHPSVFKPMKIALRNVFRVPKYAAFVFCSLSLGMVLYMAVATILGSANTDMYAQMAAGNMDSDIYLRNNKTAQYSFGDSSDFYVFESDLIRELKQMQGITGIDFTYFYEIQMDLIDLDGEMNTLPGYIYGVSKEWAVMMNEENGMSIDVDAFNRGEEAVIRDIWKNEFISKDNVEFVIGENQLISMPLGGVLPAEYQDYFGTNYNRLPCVYIVEDQLKEFINELPVYDISINVKEGDEENVLNGVKKLIENHQDIIFVSKIEERIETEKILKTLKLLGNCISGVLCFVGIINFFNIITSSILSRQREFALLEAVGQTKRQSMQIVIYEGFIYMLGTLALVVILGGGIIGGLYLYMDKQLDYMKFVVPYKSFFIMVLFIFFICLLVPLVTYKLISQDVLARRLVESD